MTTASLPDQIDFAHAASLSPPRLDMFAGAHQQMGERLVVLAALAADWDGEGARILDREALRLAGVIVTQTLRAGLPEPEIFPVPDGGVQLEWRAGPVEVELELEPERRGLIFVCDDEQARQQIDGELPVDMSRFLLAMARLNAYA